MATPTSPLPVNVVCDTALAHRRGGYTEQVQLDIGQGDVSFGPGGWTCVLELYVPNAGPTEDPIVSVSHIVGTDDTLALMILPRTQLATLFLDEYSRLVIASSPLGETYVLVDGKLSLRR